MPTLRHLDIPCGRKFTWMKSACSSFTSLPTRRSFSISTMNQHLRSSGSYEWGWGCEKESKEFERTVPGDLIVPHRPRLWNGSHTALASDFWWSGCRVTLKLARSWNLSGRRRRMMFMDGHAASCVEARMSPKADGSRGDSLLSTHGAQAARFEPQVSQPGPRTSAWFLGSWALGSCMPASRANASQSLSTWTRASR